MGEEQVKKGNISERDISKVEREVYIFNHFVVETFIYKVHMCLRMLITQVSRTGFFMFFPKTVYVSCK